MKIHLAINHQLFIALYVLLGGPFVMGANLEIYPFEPVVISVPFKTNHLDWGYNKEVVITSPNTMVLKDRLGRAHLLGVTNGNSLFLLVDARTNRFINSGTYQVVFEGVTNTVSVITPIGQDANVLPILENMTLYEVIFNKGKGELRDDLKNKYQQILNLSPAGRYSVYAKAYLAVENMYASLEAQYGKVPEPDFSTIGSEIVALSVPDNHLKWMVLFNKATAFAIRQNKQNTLDTFAALTNSIQYSSWSYTAEQYLSNPQ